MAQKLAKDKGLEPSLAFKGQIWFPIIRDKPSFAYPSKIERVVRTFTATFMHSNSQKCVGFLLARKWRRVSEFNGRWFLGQTCFRDKHDKTTFVYAPKYQGGWSLNSLGRNWRLIIASNDSAYWADYGFQDRARSQPQYQPKTAQYRNRNGVLVVPGRCFTTKLIGQLINSRNTMIFRLIEQVLMNPVVASKTHRSAEKIQTVHFKFFNPLLAVPASAGRGLDFCFHK